MKIKLFLLFTLVLLSSCKKENKTKIKTENPKKEVEEPKVEIEGLVYHTIWDGIISEGDYEEVLGEYTANRYDNTKKAISFDGLSEYTRIENHNILNLKDEITISIWYKPISFKGTGNNPLIIKPSENNKETLIQYSINVTGNEHPSEKAQASFRFSLSINGKYNSISTKPGIWSPNNWYNITGTYNGKIMRLYVDGKLQNKRSIPGKLDVYESDIFIGKNETNKFFTPGTYDDFRIFKRALEPKEVMKLYQ